MKTHCLRTQCLRHCLESCGGIGIHSPCLPGVWFGSQYIHTLEIWLLRKSPNLTNSRMHPIPSSSPSHRSQDKCHARCPLISFSFLDRFGMATLSNWAIYLNSLNKPDFLTCKVSVIIQAQPVLCLYLCFRFLICGVGGGGESV